MTTGKTFIAKSSIQINASARKVWETIVNPATLQKVMLGMQPKSDWKVGSELRWIGRHEEKPDDNAKGVIQIMEPYKKFQFTFYYPGYGYPDLPQNYNTVTFSLLENNGATDVTAEQGDFSVFKEGEVFLQHSQSFWESALKILKEVSEE
jgi:uncharacterized protein YndB with AHSA1/START domain